MHGHLAHLLPCALLIEPFLLHQFQDCPKHEGALAQPVLQRTDVIGLPALS